jgi:exo-beta-1,3-glucanase (GH17 family)
MKDETKEMIDKTKKCLIAGYDLDIITQEEMGILWNYITNSQEKIKYNDLILKALHKYFTEHEEYENDEFLKQLESCTENDMVWLKRMAGDNNG